MIVNKEMYELGSKRSAIRELFEYGKKRAAVVGPENVYDFSLGNPTVSAPACVNETICNLTTELDSISLHGYTSAQGDVETRQAMAPPSSSRSRRCTPFSFRYCAVSGAPSPENSSVQELAR